MLKERIEDVTRANQAFYEAFESLDVAPAASEVRSNDCARRSKRSAVAAVSELSGSCSKRDLDEHAR